MWTRGRSRTEILFGFIDSRIIFLGEKKMAFLRWKKTYIIAGLMVMVSIVQLIAGDTTIDKIFSSPHFNTLLSGLGLGALRSGVAESNVPGLLKRKS